MAISLPSLAYPKSQLWLQKGELDKQWTSLERRVRDHPFNHALEIFIPSCSCIRDALSSAPPPPPYFVARLPLGHFLQPHLLERYFSADNKQCPTVLTVGRRIDTHSVFALVPPGKLLLSVDKDLYEQLGVQGTPSRYRKHRYVLQVDLTAVAFRPGRPGYERVKRCFADTIPELWSDYILTWDNTDREAQEQFMTDFKARKYDNFEKQSPLPDIHVPVILGDAPHGSHDDNGEALSCSAEEVHTWLGAIACGMAAPSPGGYEEQGAPGDYISTFTPPHPLSLGKHGTRTRWNGMMTSNHICSILRDIRHYLADHMTSSPWAAVSVWGFEDAPVSWRNNEHGWFQSGDNHYNIVLFGTGQYWMLTTLATHDIQS